VVAIPNRETAIFLVPIWFVLQWRENRRASAVGVTLAAALIYIFWRRFIAHLLHSPGWVYELPWRTNLMSVLLPVHWPQLMSVFGFLAVPMWAMRSSVTDARLRAIWVSIAPFLLAALVVGIWRETRIFGELSAMVGVTFGLQIESAVSSRDWRATGNQVAAEEGPGKPS
jgi:hypothetical protein